jgi:hypothetical protein
MSDPVQNQKLTEVIKLLYSKQVDIRQLSYLKMMFAKHDKLSTGKMRKQVFHLLY